MPEPGPAAHPLARDAGQTASTVEQAPVDREAVHVMVIDNDAGTREGARRALESKGYSVRTAPDGETGLRSLAEAPCDIALVDLSLPDGNGFALSEQLLRHSDDRTVVVITSARATVEAAVEGARHGAFDFLAKPFEPEECVGVVDRAARQWRLIREREKYLSELAGERNLSHQMINSMHEGVVVFNIRREPVLMNPRAEHFLSTRFRPDMSLAEVFSHPEVTAAVEAVMDSAPEQPQCRLVQIMAGERRLQTSVSPVLRDGEAGGAIVILSDVTDAWKAEQEKNRFVSMVAHELKSPLSAIINYINVILTGMFDDNTPKIHEMLDRCKVRGEALLDLVRDLLYINSREVGKVERTIEPLDLKEVLGAQVEFFRVQADKRQIRMQLEAPFPSCPVMADRGDMDRVFMNLISNGIKYNREKGSLTVAISDQGDAWAVSVIDTGIGMSEPERACLFEEFYRAKNQKTAGIPGTGLGLATVRRVLSEYNSAITVHSQLDAGSTFVITFPKE
jgi:two-component system, OmpR family, phosphate regulon sensor histidine kinase PhoR